MHALGPGDGRVIVNVYKDGVASAIGHDLVLEVTNWSAKVDINPDDPPSSSVSATLDPRSFEIVEAKGGAKPLTDEDRKEIKKNIEKVLQTATYPEIHFEGAKVSGELPHLNLLGDVTLVGNTAHVSLDIFVNGNNLTARTRIAHSQFGLKPFALPLGVLKIKDEVDIEISLALPVA